MPTVAAAAFPFRCDVWIAMYADPEHIKAGPLRVFCSSRTTELLPELDRR